MSIAIKCKCGYRAGVSDVLAGKTIKCPKCRVAIEIPAATVGTAKKGKPAAKGERPIYLNLTGGKIVFLGTVAIGAVLGILFVTGPVHVWNQWETLGPKANDDVTDVLTFGLQAYLSERGRYNPNKAHNVPSVEEGIQFYRPGFVMSMPEKVRFAGKSSQGPFSGTYDTKTGEIEADMAYGGYSFAGAVDIVKATGSFHLTGREVNGHAQAEGDGQPLTLVVPPPDPND